VPTSPDEVTLGPADGATAAASTPGAFSRPPTTTGFTPGAIVAGRYRLVALLGRGGMGEVYRADDLTLDQPVALKFLPAGVAADDSRLAPFHNELRVARQVSHKNVVRLYDLGVAEGRRFLTMESSTAKTWRRCSAASDACRRTRRSSSRGSCAPASPPRTSAVCVTAISSRPMS
jgi:hypothetical protein